MDISNNVGVGKKKRKKNNVPILIMYLAKRTFPITLIFFCFDLGTIGPYGIIMEEGIFRGKAK